jgi:spore germination protein
LNHGNSSNDHNENEKYMLTPSQVMSLLSSTIIGIGVLTLPRAATADSDQSGWISVILGGILSIVGLWFILQLGRMFPRIDFISISQRLLGTHKTSMVGKVLTFPFVLVFIVFWFGSTASVARTFGDVVVTAVLIKTPLEVIVGSMLVIGFVMVMCDLEAMARVHEVLLPIIIIPVLLIALFSFQSATFIRLLPVFDVEWKDLFKGIMATVFSFQGFETLAIYMGNVDIRTQHMKRAAMTGMVIPMVVYALITIAGITSFGFEELQRLMWPTLELVKTTEMPGLVLERLESAFLGVWVAAVFTTFAGFYFTACYAAKQLFQLKSHRSVAIIMFPVLYFVAMWPENVHQLFDYLDIIAYLGVGITFSSLPLLFFIALLRRGKKEAPAMGEQQ